MKILVVGTGYIGRNFVEYATKNYKNYTVETVDSRTGWATKNFDGYSTVVFTAGIAHRKQTNKNKNLYYNVNCKLAVEVAKKAKAAKVIQFIYLSSMAVYGIRQGEITQDTIPTVGENDYYGHSKLKGEKELKKLECENFKIGLIRPPMVYGKNAPGKFGQLIKLSKFMAIAPNTKNKRSIIYIDNLCEFLCILIKENAKGIFCPQNKNYENTADLIQKIRKRQGKKTILSTNLGKVINLLMYFCPPLKTAFSSLYYVHFPRLPNGNIDYLCINSDSEEY